MPTDLPQPAEPLSDSEAATFFLVIVYVIMSALTSGLVYMATSSGWCAGVAFASFITLAALGFALSFFIMAVSERAALKLEKMARQGGVTLIGVPDDPDTDSG